MKFEKIINEAWNKKEKISKTSDKKIIEAIEETIDLVYQGILRVAEKKESNGWSTNGLKKQFC